MIPFDRPHAWDAHGRAREAINSLGDPHGAHGAARLPRSDSTAATNTAPNTPTRASSCASRLPKEALGSLSTPHMRVARMGSFGGSYVVEGVEGGFNKVRGHTDGSVGQPLHSASRTRHAPHRPLCRVFCPE